MSITAETIEALRLKINATSNLELVSNGEEIAETFCNLIKENKNNKTNLQPEFGEFLKSLIPLNDRGRTMFNCTVQTFDRLYAQVEEYILNNREAPEFLKDKTQINEVLFDKYLKILFDKLITVENKETSKAFFKHFMVNVKRNLFGQYKQHQQMLTLWSKTKGCGKNTIIDNLYKALFDTKPNYRYFGEVTSSSYNSSLKGELGFIIVNEASLKGSDFNRLKSIITSDVISINEKYKPSLDIGKRFEIAHTSNEDPCRYFGGEAVERRNASIHFLGRNVNFVADGYENDGMAIIEFFRRMWILCPIEYSYDTNELIMLVEETKTDEVSTYIDYIVNMFAQPIERKFMSDSNWAFNYNKRLTLKQLTDFFKQNHIEFSNYTMKKFFDDDKFFTRKDAKTKLLAKDLRLLIAKVWDKTPDEISEAIYNHYEMEVVCVEEWSVNSIKGDVDIIELINKIEGKNTPEPTPRKLFLSKADRAGSYSNILNKVDELQKDNILSYVSTPEATKDELNDRKEKYSTLLSEGYNSTEDSIGRKEENFDSIDFVLLDFDGGKTKETFKQQYNNNTYIMYGTMKDGMNGVDKYRVLLPLSDTLNVKGKTKIYKKAKSIIFGSDPNCQMWFCSPTKDAKIDYNDGSYFDVNIIKSEMNKIEEEENKKKFNQEMKAFNLKRSLEASGVNNKLNVSKYFDKVAETINDSVEGNRNTTINKSIQSIFKNNNISTVDWKSEILSRLNIDKIDEFNKYLQAHHLA